MTEKKPLTDREQLVNQKVINIISDGYDYMFERFDKLHKQDITDTEVVAALRHYGEEDVLDGYVEWADIDVREDDNTTTNPVVPDPGNAPSYDALESREPIDNGFFRAEPANQGGWHIYKKRSADDNGAHLGHYETRETALRILTLLKAGKA